jgi:molybdate transport system ATP-binding protein
VSDLEVTVAVADRGVDVAFTVAAGEVLAVVGPNGAGKSTAVSVVAGLLHADRARVRVGDRTLTDTDTGVHVAVHDRRVGLLQQDPLLFPHMTVMDNVVFAARHGRRVTRSGPGAQHWLDWVGAAEMANRRPAELSGGQAQRVALARALAADPDVLLLDEPLAGLDVAGAAAVRPVLRDVLTHAGVSSRPAVLVTHDLLDVLGIADRVLVLERGVVAESGPVAGFLAAPRSRFGARIAGVNVVRGVLTGPTTTGPTRLSSAGAVWHGVPAEILAETSEVVAVFPPAAVAVYPDKPRGSPRNSIEVRIAAIDMTGGAIRVRGTEQPDGAPGLAADITPEAVAELRLAVGKTVWMVVKTQSVSLHGGHRSVQSP